MNRQRQKKYILELLATSSWQKIEEALLTGQANVVFNTLFGALCRADETIKFNAVRGFGLLVPRLADKDGEKARQIMRRFLWNLNDESGGIGWGIPEAMAEVMAESTVLFREYKHMLLSYMRDDGQESFAQGNFLELPGLQRGLLWGVARLIDCRRAEMLESGVHGDCARYLFSEDSIVRAYAAWCLGLLGAVEYCPKIELLLGNSRSLLFFWEGTLAEITVGELAARALVKLE